MKVIAIIDGFNYYHRIHEYVVKNPQQADLKWLDYNALIHSFFERGDQLEATYFCTAIADDMPSDVKERHRNYLSALQATGITIIEGNFKRKEKRCRAECGKKYWTREEKETDVNMAIFLLVEAFKGNYDKCLLFTSDSDMVPAIKAVTELYPNKQIILAPPPGSQGLSSLLSACGNKRIKVRFQTLFAHRLPKTVSYQGQTLQCPYPYRRSRTPTPIPTVE